MVNPDRRLLILPFSMVVLLEGFYQIVFCLFDAEMQFFVFPDPIPFAALCQGSLSDEKISTVGGNTHLEIVSIYSYLIFFVKSYAPYQLHSPGLQRFLLLIIKRILKHLVIVAIYLFQRKNKKLLPAVVPILLNVKLFNLRGLVSQNLCHHFHRIYVILVNVAQAQVSFVFCQDHVFYELGILIPSEKLYGVGIQGWRIHLIAEIDASDKFGIVFANFPYPQLILRSMDPKLKIILLL